MIWVLLILLFTSYFPRAHDSHEIHSRQMAGMTLLLLWLASQFPNPYLGLLLAVGALGAWWAPLPLNTHKIVLLPALPWILSYYLGASTVTPAWIVPLLSGCVGIGLIQAAWLCYSVVIGGRYYRHRILLWEVYEDHWSGLTAGATNTNLTEAISGVTTAAALGLAWCESPLWLLSAMLCALPILVNQGMLLDRDLTPTQGTVFLATLPCAAVLVLGGWLGWLAIGILFWSVILWGWRHRHTSKLWSLRDVLWVWAWKIYRSLPIAGKLFGAGTGSWLPLYVKDGPTWRGDVSSGQMLTKHLATHPHNEFVHIGFEQGVVGLTALCAYLATGLWTASQGTPQTQAVAFVGWVLCAAAFLQWPWTQFHEVAFQSKPDPASPILEQQTMGHGIPTLNALSVVIAILLEAR